MTNEEYELANSINLKMLKTQQDMLNEMVKLNQGLVQLNNLLLQQLGLQQSSIQWQQPQDSAPAKDNEDVLNNENWFIK